MQKAIFPKATIGILGGGQLGMMLAQVAKRFSYKVVVFEPDANCPAKYIADKHIIASYSDTDAIIDFAKQCDVVTTEFENVPANVVRLIAESTPVYPSDSALEVAQNRIKEKTFFNQIGLHTAPFKAINLANDIDGISLGMFPAILKTSTLGYDGKGQVKVGNQSEFVDAYTKLGSVECILEKMVDLKQEVSIIIARNQTGNAVYPVIENQHRNGILDISYFPANIDENIKSLAHEAAIKIADGLNYVGLLTIEFFITQDNQLLINEIAPRPHNSGHVTIEASVTSQFEQQLRAVCGLKLGSTDVIKSGAMLNLLGDVWLDNTNADEVLLNHNPQAKLHSYNKLESKRARKMGHVTILNNNRNRLEESISDLKQALKIPN